MKILNEIFDHKRLEVESAKMLVPEASLRELAVNRKPPRGFRMALLQDPRPVALIAEVKMASPSEGVIRADFNASEIASTYEMGGAACLSVLTDAKFFQGTSEHLRLAREAVSIPILRKDFLYDPYQLWEALAWGADAVLLIVAHWLEGSHSVSLESMFHQAKKMGLDVLVEVHNQQETEVALRLGADLIGVNNRDLSTFETDLSTSERLIPLITPHAVAVSESAIGTPDDLRRVMKAGARGVLVGTSFCRESDIAGAMQRLLAGVE